MFFRRFWILSLLGIGLIVLPGLGCRGGSREAQQSLQPVELTIWRVFDSQDTFDPLIEDYRRIHPNVRINYRKLRFEEYEDELIRALAEDRGPDIFSVHNSWMKGYTDLIEPMPDTLRITYQEIKGTIKKEPVVTIRNERTMSLRELNDDYVQVVPGYVVYPATDDNGTQNRIYGLPLSVDTLALYYNKEILDAAGIPQPPSTWEDFQEAIIALTKYDANGGIAQSGAAIGTGSNIERSADIMSLLMMQSGSQMTDARGQARFAEAVSGSGGRTLPSADALRFYTDFANPTKEVYTWDQSFTNSFDAFAAGQTAFFFGYSYHAPLLEAQAQKLDIELSPMPQITDDLRARINYANFWVESVSKKSEHSDWAWDFIQFAADEDNVEDFLDAAGKPTALRSLVLRQSEDFNLSVFADQVLSAQAWYNGDDATAAERAMEEMIDSVVAGTNTVEEALGIAQNEVNQSL